MKCPDCWLCLNIFTLFLNDSNQLFYRCELCGSVYRNVRGKAILLEDSEQEIIDLVEKSYEDKFEELRKRTQAGEKEVT